MAGAMTIDNVYAALEDLRARRPLVHNITNYVAMTVSANVLLALGASPAMVHAVEEVEDFVAISDALAVNIGTLSPPWVEAMRAAVARARALGKPWVLDPVGCGATAYRTQVAAELAGLKPSVIRGNASEIMSLAGQVGAGGKGVDSTAPAEYATLGGCGVGAAQPVASWQSPARPTMSATGRRCVAVHAGHALMPLSTALGCSLSAVTAAFTAVRPPREAAIAALAVFGAAGAVAAKRCRGPGHLPAEICDALHRMDRATLAGHARLSGSETSLACKPASPSRSSPTRRSRKRKKSCAPACIAASAPPPARLTRCSAMNSIRRAGASTSSRRCSSTSRPATREVVKHIDRCLSCLACMTTCPSGVHYMHLVDHARDHIEKTYKRPLADRAMRGLLARVLPDPGLFRLAVVAGLIAKPFAGVLRAIRLEADRGHAAADAAPQTGVARSIAPARSMPRRANAVAGWRYCPAASVRCWRRRPTRPPSVCSTGTASRWWSPPARPAAARSSITWAARSRRWRRRVTISTPGRAKSMAPGSTPS